jgi:hypothetical protein
MLEGAKWLLMELPVLECFFLAGFTSPRHHEFVGELAEY